MSGTDHKPAFVIWVDAVGGFLVCPSDSVVIGQAVAAGTIDIPIFGDLSRKHALITRQGEGYTVGPLGEGRVAVGDNVGKSFLAAGDRITLGSDVKLDFSRPHPLSGTGRLTPASSHRIEPRTDAVILMAESCVIGAKLNSHIVCPDWMAEIVLFRQGEALFCRANVDMTIDGQPVGRRGELTLASTVAGEDFSFTLEPV